MAENERVARLELRVEQLEKRMDESNEDRVAIHQGVLELQETLLRQRTFIGGILFTVGSIWAILQVTWDYIQNRFLR